MSLQQDIEELSKEFEKIHLRSFGLDSMLSVFLGIHYVNRFQPYTAIDAFKDLGSLIKQYIKSSTKPHSRIVWHTMPLLTFMSERAHIFKMSKEILEVAKGRVNVFWTLNSEPSFQVHGTLVRRSSLNYSLKFNSDPDLQCAYRQGIVLFRKFLKTKGLSSWRMFSFKIHLRRQLALIQFFESQFESTRPISIITEYDRYNELASLIIAAKKFDIKTVTQVHGMLNARSSYVPILADMIGCWGQWQKNQLIEWGVPEGQIKITGATHFSDSFELEPENDFEIPFALRDKKILILATNPTIEIRQALMTYFCRTLEILGDGYCGIVRLHPSEYLEDYQVWLQSDKVHILKNQRVQNWAFKTCKAVITFNSAFAIDAMLVGKTVIQLKVSDSIQTALNRLIEEDIIPVCKIEDELSELIHQMETESFQKELNEKKQIFNANYCQYYGSEAAQQYCNFLN